MRTRREWEFGFRKSLLCLLFAGASLACASSLGSNSTLPGNRSESLVAMRNDAAAKAAFLAAYPVFMHPRCLNCHPMADAPLQGDDSHPHAQNVQRGRDGKGKYALKCSNCHQLENLPGENLPPGVANWHMPPANMKMVFEGKSAGELCRQFKDPKQNGGHSVEGAIEHLEADPLVLWGWSPGDGRSTPPLSHAEFARKMLEWLRNGAACPE